MPGCSAGPVVTMLVCFLFDLAREAAGASRARHSLRPLSKRERTKRSNLARNRAARSRSCVPETRRWSRERGRGVLDPRARTVLCGARNMECIERRLVNSPVTSFVYTPPTISPSRPRGLIGEWVRHVAFQDPGFGRSAVDRRRVRARRTVARPAALHRHRRPSVQIASVPWHADLHVSFTDDPALATVRVQLSDSADAADFAVIDDADSSGAGSCAANPATRLVSISASPSADAPVIYLSSRRPGRLPDLRALEDLHRARCGGAGRRRRRRTSPAGRRGALTLSFLTRCLDANRHPLRSTTPCVNLALTTFSSPRATPRGRKQFARSQAPLSAPGQRAAKQVSGSSAWDGFSGSNYTCAASPAAIRG